jgi:hypothetical protein
MEWKHYVYNFINAATTMPGKHVLAAKFVSEDEICMQLIM